MKINVKLSYDEETILLKLGVVASIFLLFFVVASLLIDVKSGLIVGVIMGTFFGLRVLLW